MSIFNPLIKAAIDAKKPWVFGKIGITEGLMLRWRLEGLTKWWDSSLETNSGMYPLGPVNCERWTEIYTEALGALDGAVVWHPDGTDAPLLDRYAPRALKAGDHEDLLPLGLGADSWHYQLAGKRVLVVHPFRATIYHQVPKFSQLWPGASIGDVTVVKTPYSPAVTRQVNPKIKDWFTALDILKFQIDSWPYFDLAVVGCGSYALPLAKHIKEQHKTPVIHLAGKTQLLFGILGKRWDNFGIDWRAANSYGGEHWVRPLDIDRPPGLHQLDSGCYW